MNGSASKLGIAACCLFLVSLVLPAAEVTILSAPALVLGWEAAASSLALWAGDMSDPEMFALALAAISNLVFVLAPWMVLRNRGHNLSRTYAVSVGLALLLAVALPRRGSASG